MAKEVSILWYTAVYHSILQVYCSIGFQYTQCNTSCIPRLSNVRFVYEKMKGEGLGVFIVTDCDVCDVCLDREKGRGAPDQNNTFYAHILYPEN